MKHLKRVCSFILALLLMVSILSIPASAAGDANAKITGTFCYDYARSELSMINDFRTGSEAWYWNSDDSTKTQYAPGELGTLVLDPKLEQIAMERARELVLYFSHTRPNGTSCFSLTVDGCESWGENIAYGFSSPESVFSAWREDNYSYSGQGHRRNMLGKSYTAVGFGCFYHQGIYYWVQEFGYASGEPAPSKTDTEVTGYVEYSTSVLGENYWSDEGNCPMSEYTPPSIVEGEWSYTVDNGKATITGYSGGYGDIVIPSKLGGYPVTALADELFSDEYYIDSVVFPDSLETIGTKAFFNSGLEGKVTIPASVKSIGTYAFSYCSYVKEFSVNSNNAYYCSYNSALYTKNKATLLNYPLANTAESYTVPEETTLLYCTSFANARYLKDLYVSGQDVRAMTYTFYGDSFNVWCWPESTLYSQISNGSISGSVVLQSIIKPGWVKNGAYWMYRNADGSYVKSAWKKISGKWYHFDSNGYMQTGWLKEGEKWYYLNASGVMQTGWLSYSGNWYYLNTSGEMQVGWQKISDKWYYFNSSGTMVTGWKQLSGKWYFFSTSGNMVTGWRTISGKTYFFKTSGAMAANEWCSGWWLNQDGSWTYKYQASWKQDSKGWWYGDGSGWYAKNATYIIDGTSYRFNASGYWVK